LADLRRTSFRLGLGLALAVVGLFEVLSLLHGVRSVRRLRVRIAHDAEERVLAARPRLEAALAGGGQPAWQAAASYALAQGLASEVDVLDPSGRVVFSRPATSAVPHELTPDERRRLGAGRPRSLVAQQGDEVRVFVYIALPRADRGASFRMASPAPDLEQELRERQQVFAGHLASLAALAVAAALALLPREGERSAPPEAALHAYEQAMEQLRDQGEEMSARHDAERRRMEEAIREKEALVRAGELTAGIAHEVRNGLGTIAGYARLLERASLPEDPAAAARAIREECETLETVVRRFTDFVKLDRLQLADTDLSRLIARVVAREQRARDEVSTRLLGLDAPLVVRADEELLERAFENLVRNAVEAAAGGGRHVEVSARELAGQVEVRIDDDGPGLAAGHPGEIRPFYTTRPGGLGLGLPLARKIVLLHGGSLDLAGKAPVGARVLVLLPSAGPAF
jgi:signal transduction histidine kinase